MKTTLRIGGNQYVVAYVAGIYTVYRLSHTVFQTSSQSNLTDWLGEQYKAFATSVIDDALVRQAA